MSPTIEADICVIGAGSAGLSVAAGTGQLGLRTVLIEAGEMGGDCLNTGCVPSKALLSATAALRAHPGEGAEDFRGRINEHVRRAQQAIAPHDSQERFEGLGVTVLRSRARFLDPETVQAGETRVRARHFVVATGSRAAMPPIPGLDPARVLTNESIFDLATVPEHLVIVGGGPIGIEMAQAHRQMGSRVTVLEKGAILPKDDPELVAVVRERLAAQGVVIREGVEIESVEHGTADHTVRVRDGNQPEAISGSHILVAAGRKPNIEDLGLDAGGIAHARQGIKVDARLRTTNRRVFAVGDVAGGPQFTHVASYHGAIAVQNIVFHIPAKVDYAALPWVTYTDPELAHVGMTLRDARARYGSRCEVITRSFSGLDRAQTSGGAAGIAKAIVTSRGRILGCSIVGPHAGELIGLWGLAISRRMTLRDITRLILPYPSYGEIAKHVASDFYRPKLFSAWPRRIASWLKVLPAA
ncbi:MAG: FAD-dependent oxidoreductase [Devosia sp.]|nr:FAD-dependent oxidoreductase [Devosia sp.]